MSHSSRLASLIAVPFLLLPAAAAADKTRRPLADAALDGTNTATDKRITKAFFFVGPYFVRYDWGKDRVDDGYPVAIDPNALAKDAGWTDGIRAAHSVFGEPDSFLFRGKEFLIYDWNPAVSHEVKPLTTFPDGVDSAVHGLGAEHNFDYFFLGGELVKFDRRTKTAGERKPIAATFKLDRVDAAVNGAGNFIGFAYLFQDDRYVKYDWAAGRLVGGKPKLTQPNFPGLVEIVEAARALERSRTWYDAALPALRKERDAALANKLGDLATATRIAETFAITTPEERAAHLPGIVNRLETAAARAKNPEGTFRFRTTDGPCRK